MIALTHIISSLPNNLIALMSHYLKKCPYFEVKCSSLNFFFFLKIGFIKNIFWCLAFTKYQRGQKMLATFDGGQKGRRTPARNSRELWWRQVSCGGGFQWASTNSCSGRWWIQTNSRGSGEWIARVCVQKGEVQTRKIVLVLKKENYFT